MIDSANRLPHWRRRGLRSLASHGPAPNGQSRANFNLTRRFAVLSLLSILAVSLVSAALLSRALAERIIHHDAKVFQSFVDSAIPGEVARTYFAEEEPAAGQARRMDSYFAEVTSLPDVVHANVYDQGKRVRWSTKPDMVGKVLPLNHELDEALEGRLAVESNILEDRQYLKPEHVYLVDLSRDFVETYVPIWDTGRKHVLGVIEVYRTPKALFEMTWQLIRGAWLSALLGGLFLFGVLFWVVRRADRLIREQQRQIVEQETLAAVGEMSAAVAHSIRNPLASIRSSAELMQDAGGAVRSTMSDIISEVDRIALWIKELLIYGQSTPSAATPIDLRDAIRASLETYQREFDKHGVRVQAPALDAPVETLGDTSLLVQVFNSVFANACEAMPQGGTLSVTTAGSPQRGRVEVVIADSGIGMTPDQLERVFVPFHTTKKKGLGIGLPLIKRVVERLGGTVSIVSDPGTGTKVHLSLPAGQAS